MKLINPSPIYNPLSELPLPLEFPVQPTPFSIISIRNKQQIDIFHINFCWYWKDYSWFAFQNQMKIMRLLLWHKFQFWMWLMNEIKIRFKLDLCWNSFCWLVLCSDLAQWRWGCSSSHYYNHMGAATPPPLVTQRQ